MVPKLLAKLAQFRQWMVWSLIGLSTLLFAISSGYDEKSHTPVFQRSINSVGLKMNATDLPVWQKQLDVKNILIDSGWNDSTGQFGILPEQISKKTPREYGRQALSWDILFILFFTVLLMLWIQKLDTKKAELKVNYSSHKVTRNAGLAIAGMCFDIVENGMGLGLLAGSGSHWFLNMMFLVSVFKWLCYLRIIASYLVVITEFVRGFLAVLRENIVQTVAIVLLYGVFFLSDQGQNLLINLNEYDLSVVIFCFVVSFFAIFNWHFSKFSQNKEIATTGPLSNFYSDFNWSNPGLQKRMVGASYTQFYIAIPRMFGVLTFLIPACALLNVTAITHPGTPFAKFFDPQLMLLLISGIYFYLFQNDVFNQIVRRIPQWASNLFLGFLVFILLAMYLLNDGSIYSIKWFAIALIDLSLFFAFFTSVRNESARNSDKPIRFLGIDLSREKVNKPVFYASLVFALLGVVILILNFTLAINYCQYLLPVLSMIFVLYEIVLSALIIAGWRTGANYVVILFVFVAVFYSLIDNNTYRLREGSEKCKTTQVPEMETYMNQWLNARKNEIEKKKNYDVYFINGHGGGIRASAYFYFTLRELDGEYQKLHKESIIPHVFSMSTASGSSLGAVCAVSDLQKTGKLRSTDEIYQLMRKDYLSPVLLGLVAGDFISMFNDNWNDRDILQEKNWEKYAPGLTRNYFNIYSEDNKRQLPALLFNTSESQSGQSALIAPFRFKPADLEGRMNATEQAGTMHFNLSTAAILTARFPLISPAARTKTNAYFHDGGMTENSGIRSSMEVCHALQKIIEDRLKSNPADSSWLNHIRFRYISIANSMTAHDVKAYEKLGQNGSLMKMIAGAGLNGNTGAFLQKAKAETLNNPALFYEFIVNKNGMKTQRPPLISTIAGSKSFYIGTILPLGWQLSGQATDKLMSSANEEVKKHPEILK
ncbi:MAG: hypothetical protein JNL57_03955 [Bacteroidetes bacterium]|nr:hypothetical protein [Bacteroidota bacterium]